MRTHAEAPPDALANSTRCTSPIAHRLPVSPSSVCALVRRAGPHHETTAIGLARRTQGSKSPIRPPPSISNPPLRASLPQCELTENKVLRSPRGPSLTFESGLRRANLLVDTVWYTVPLSAPDSGVGWRTAAPLVLPCTPTPRFVRPGERYLLDHSHRMSNAGR